MKFEWSFQDQFDVILVNDKLEEAVAEAQALFDKLKQS
jgi:guanylate kinase